MTNISISIISDAVCPWCYIGLRRLTNAITTHKATHPTTTFTLTWHAFYLNPTAPAYPGFPKTEHYSAKFGADRTAAIFARLAAVGENEGIKFRFGGRTGKTRDAHRLVWYAGGLEGTSSTTAAAVKGKADGEVGGLQTRVVEALFKAYFEEEKNITDRGVLVEAAAAAGLDTAAVEKFLAGEEGGKEVDAEAEKARGQLVSGVPFFTIQDRYVVEGAEEPAAFLEIFEKVAEL
ncbi:DsbA family oxidoreductase [Aspergillus candidus]|uniref:Thioredoxin-like protein n=1 Tax=Aspergillus candidus TaxID=41067 RepID=A0A2I2FEW4_ASPCN|nr:thioredoxin-like protein [Aspergillus candidus]PLB39181.1 thioredoxin-like protein [Aspergillus candidus]